LNVKEKQVLVLPDAPARRRRSVVLAVHVFRNAGHSKCGMDGA